jgi:hypothetical protein
MVGEPTGAGGVGRFRHCGVNRSVDLVVVEGAQG